MVAGREPGEGGDPAGLGATLDGDHFERSVHGDITEAYPPLQPLRDLT